MCVCVCAWEKEKEGLREHVCVEKKRKTSWFAGDEENAAERWDQHTVRVVETGCGRSGGDGEMGKCGVCMVGVCV